MLKNNIKKCWGKINYTLNIFEKESPYQKVLSGLSSNRLESGYKIS